MGDMISRKALLEDLRESVNWLHKNYDCLIGEDEKRICSAEMSSFTEAIFRVKEAPAVDAIPIDTVAEMLADLFGDCCPCNYNDLDEVLSIGCERKNCPGFFEDDYSCWKKYVERWKVMKDAVD